MSVKEQYKNIISTTFFAETIIINNMGKLNKIRGCGDIVLNVR